MGNEFSLLVASLSNAVSISKALVGLRDSIKANDKVVEFQQAMIEANSHVMAVQQKYLTMTARVKELNDENIRLKDWSREKENFALREIGIGPAVFSYVKKDFVGNPEIAEKLCCNCFDQGMKSLLHNEKIQVGRRIAVNCHRCKARDVFECWAR